MNDVKMLRLDKYLAELSVGTRSEVKALIRRSRITINGEVCKSPEQKVNSIQDIVAVDGRVLTYQRYEYYMLNKPAGVVSATTDEQFTTVIELIEQSNRKDLFPVGRLDKDTEGLLLITNDGELAHNLLSPKKHVDKVYYARVKGNVNAQDIVKFKEGLVVDEEFHALPSELVVLAEGEISEIKLTIREGKFHQVKRMFEAVGKEVIYLKRLSMGSLVLDETLLPGEYRKLSEDEIINLKQSEREKQC